MFERDLAQKHRQAEPENLAIRNHQLEERCLPAAVGKDTRDFEQKVRLER